MAVRMLHGDKVYEIEYETPKEFFNELDKEFRFTLDPCSTHANAKCAKHYTKEENGLLQDWGGERVFMNPPYGKEIVEWVKKAAESNTLVVALIPARTDTKWFHTYVLPYAEIRFIKGRLKFGNSKKVAPFSNLIAIYKGKEGDKK